MTSAAIEHVLRIRPEDIPEELKSRPQWVVWKLETRDGKPTKVPYKSETGRRASVTELMTWSAFEDALEAYEFGKPFRGWSGTASQSRRRRVGWEYPSRVSASA